jgi:hypothetical protein
MLEQAESFAATISGFGTGDTTDATNFLKTGTTFNFVETPGSPAARSRCTTRV